MRLARIRTRRNEIAPYELIRQNEFERNAHGDLNRTISELAILRAQRLTEKRNNKISKVVVIQFAHRDPASLPRIVNMKIYEIRQEINARPVHLTDGR
jgi:hypothetical protein